MQLISVIQDQKLVVKVKGKFIAKDILKVRQQIEGYQLKAHKVLLIDLSKVDLIDSSGIGILVFLAKRLKARGASLVIIGLNKQPLALFESLGLHNLFDCFESYQSYTKYTKRLVATSLSGLLFSS